MKNLLALINTKLYSKSHCYLHKQAVVAIIDGLMLSKLDSMWRGACHVVVILGKTLNSLHLDINMVILQTFLSTFLVIHGENLFQTVKSLLRRGGEGTGVIRKCKTIEIQNCKTKKNLIKSQKPYAKPSKPINFHIPVVKTLIDPQQWWQVEHTEVLQLFQISRGP